MTPRDRLIHDHIDLVKIIAAKAWQGYPASIELDDMIQSGMIGLIQAADKFDVSKGFKFKTFAQPRIFGAIIDALRVSNAVSRNVFEEMKKIQYAKELLTILGKDSSVEQLSKITLIKKKRIREVLFLSNSIDVSVEDFNKITNREKRSYLNETMLLENGLTHLLEKEKKKEIQKLLKRLTRRQQEVIRMYFFEDKLLKQVGKELHVTESRAFQILKQGLEKLRDLSISI